MVESSAAETRRNATRCREVERDGSRGRVDKRGGGVACGGGGAERRRSKREKSVIASERGTSRERQGGKAARVPRSHNRVNREECARASETVAAHERREGMIVEKRKRRNAGAGERETERERAR